MNRFARLLRLEPAARGLSIEAAVLLGMIAPGLKFGPSALTGRLIRRASTASSGTADPVLVAEVAAAVRRAAYQVRGGTCLAQALTGWLMMTCRHQPATVRLGVNRDRASGLSAHAWLECNGARIIGGDAAGEYAPFPMFS